MWKQQMMQCMQNRQNCESADCAGYWDTPSRARHYLNHYGGGYKTGTKRIFQTLQKLNLNPDTRVLEIGAGPGVLSIPIAQQVHHLTAVEPSPGMATVFEEEMKKHSLTNIRLIQQRWEEVSIDELGDLFDIVLASFSLGMPDIKPALMKMNEVCQGRVHLIWHAGIPQFEVLHTMLWPQLYNCEYNPIPKSDLLFNVLYSMDIYPDVTFYDFTQTHHFISYDELSTFFLQEYYLDFNPENEVFQEYLNSYIEEKDGYILHHEHLPGMIFSYKP